MNMNMTFGNAATKCCKNSERLLDDADMLGLEHSPATYYYLAMIAQEEAAKAFLLYLVAVDALPWTGCVLRATRDHRCKQLVGLIMEYLLPDTDEFLRRVDASLSVGGRLHLPASIADAVNILRHEKMRRWESTAWVWEEDPDYDKTAMWVAEGGLDGQKQRAIYVELGKTGLVSATPELITKAQAHDEHARARRFQLWTRSLVDGGPQWALELEMIETCFRTLFSSQITVLESKPI